MDLAKRLRAYRISAHGASLSQVALARRSGVGLTPLKRFEKTGGISLNNLVALLRALNLLPGIQNLVPDTDSPSPLQLLKASRVKPRQRASRISRPAPDMAHARTPRRG